MSDYRGIKKVSSKQRKYMGGQGQRSVTTNAIRVAIKIKFSSSTY